VGAAIAGLLCCFGVASALPMPDWSRRRALQSRRGLSDCRNSVACRPGAGVRRPVGHHARTGHGGGLLFPAAFIMTNGVQIISSRCSTLAARRDPAAAF